MLYPQKKQKIIMSLTENTHLKNITPAAGDLNPSVEIGFMQGQNYQRPVLIIAGSLLTLLVWIVMIGKSAGHHFQSSTHEMADGSVSLADYQVDSTNLALTKDMFGLGAVSENDEGKIQNRIEKLKWSNLYSCIGIHWLTTCISFLHLLIFWVGWVSTNKWCKLSFLLDLIFLVWLWNVNYLLFISLIDSLLVLIFLLFLFILIVVAGMILAVWPEVTTLYGCEIIIILNQVHLLNLFLLRYVCCFFPL